MNKQLRFRAWDKHEGKWLFGYEYPNLGGFSLIGEVVLFGELAKFSLDYYQHIVFMQTTGLKDKFGKEIYEGDILEFKNELGRHHKYTVFSVDGGLAINTHKSDFGKETQFYDACADMQTSQWIKQCAVIGNIYQNADLLQDVG